MAVNYRALVRWLFASRLSPTTKAERQRVAASTREFRRLAGLALLTLCVLLPLVVIAVLRVVSSSRWLPMELS